MTLGSAAQLGFVFLPARKNRPEAAAKKKIQSQFHSPGLALSVYKVYLCMCTYAWTLENELGTYVDRPPS